MEVRIFDGNEYSSIENYNITNVDSSKPTLIMYTHEIYFKIYNDQTNSYENFKSQNIIVKSLTTDYVANRTTHETDGYIALNLNLNEKYEIIIDSDKKYTIDVNNTGSNYFEKTAEGGTYQFSDVYLKEIK